MSRPFSYNDENFTVVGNMLFCHILSKKDIEDDGIVVEIPPEIFKRVYQSSVLASLVRKLDKDLYQDSYTRHMYLYEDNGKYYLRTKERAYTDFMFIAYLPLKDI